MQITSTNNSLVKAVLSLHDKKGRRQSGAFLLEGRRELELACQNGVSIQKILYCPELAADLAKYPGEKIAVSAKVLARLAYRGETEGFVAVAAAPDRRLTDWTVPARPFVVALDHLEKPGNIGAVLRTADAAGVSAVFICADTAELYNPNLIRSSLGAVFTVPVFCLTSEQAVEWLHKHRIPIVTASPYAKQSYWQSALSGALALVIGSEKDGLSSVWVEQAAAEVIIPMSGAVDSLNASVSAALLIYEALRQRKLGAKQSFTI